ncbi:Gfo/Idh/MocA family oxidoreductase [Maridesulfovibrio bastinii]|uniref:Gfo/Idh/MocA family oxidoreductase n=1 Tax=Maridesulfovibrio bastinii TaxID=47157 RepID=UPI00041598A3
MKKNIAVIGTGYWGKNLVRNFYQLGVLRAMCDSTTDTLVAMSEQYKGVKTTTSYQHILDDPKIEGIVIATPAETHFKLVEKALDAGKDVYVEKPLVLNEATGKKLIALAKEKERILMVGHLLHYHPAFIRLKEMAKDGKLGRINYIYSNRLNLGKIRREENILFSFAPHDISMILSLAGELPESVMATGGSYLRKKIADVTTTHLDFNSDLKAHIFVSWLHPFKEQKLVVVGDKKMAVFDDTKPWDEKLLIYSHSIEWKNGSPVPLKADAEKVDIEEKEPLRSECAQFIDSIKTRKEPYTNGIEGLNVLKVLNAAQLSMNENGKVIKISEKQDNEEWFAHETVVIDSGVTIGAKTKIWNFSHILGDVSIGERVSIGQNVVVGPNVSIGNGCKIQNNVSVYNGVTLEDDVFCGPSMVFTNVFNPRAHIPRMDELRPTLVKKGATLGANSTIVCGVTIGQYSMIGAGATVTKDVKPNALMIGTPARQTGWVCDCGVKLGEDLFCESCNLQYVKTDDGIVKAG